jgi:NADPH:quinone reductase-like Zn-dependent oxidoreductase
LMGGYNVSELNLIKILHKHLTISGTTLRSRPLAYKSQLVQAFAEKYLGCFETGEISPVIDSIYKLEDMAEAHRRMEANKNIGKIVLAIG